MASTKSAPVFYLVNAFAIERNGGNQAAVVLLPQGDARGNDDAWCAAVARNFGLPMTALVTPIDAGPDAPEPQYKLRWFTPTGLESQLCGHATLATSFVLFTKIHPSARTVHFDTVRGPLAATFQGDGTRSQGAEVGITLPPGGPAAPGKGSEAAAAVVVAASSLEPADIEEVAMFENGRSAVVRLNPSVQLKDVQLDPSKLTPTPQHYMILTQLVGTSGNGIRINSRVFKPNAGIPEDPVTGSAHTVLAQYFLLGHARPAVAQLVSDPAAATLDAQQHSKRGGAMRVTIVDGKVRAVGRAWLWGEGALVE